MKASENIVASHAGRDRPDFSDASLGQDETRLYCLRYFWSFRCHVSCCCHHHVSFSSYAKEENARFIGRG